MTPNEWSTGVLDVVDLTTMDGTVHALTFPVLILIRSAVTIAMLLIE